MESGELYLAHEDGDSPTPLFVSAAPGESGVSVLRLQFPGGAYYGATLRQHFVRFQMSPQVRLESALAWRAVRYDATVDRWRSILQEWSVELRLKKASMLFLLRLIPTGSRSQPKVRRLERD